MFTSRGANTKARIELVNESTDAHSRVKVMRTWSSGVSTDSIVMSSERVFIDDEDQRLGVLTGITVTELDASSGMVALRRLEK